MKPQYYETTRKCEWKRSRATQECRIARKDANEETRSYYAHRHVLETTYETLIGTVEVKIDLDSIVLDMAMTAARSGSGRSTKYGGAIKAKRLGSQVIATYAVPTPIPEGYSIVDQWDALLRRTDLVDRILTHLYDEEHIATEEDAPVQEIAAITSAIAAVEDATAAADKEEHERREAQDL